MWNLKCGTNEPIYRIGTDSAIENRLEVAKWEGKRRKTNWEFEINRCKLLYTQDG